MGERRRRAGRGLSAGGGHGWAGCVRGIRKERGCDGAGLYWAAACIGLVPPLSDRLSTLGRGCGNGLKMRGLGRRRRLEVLEREGVRIF